MDFWPALRNGLKPFRQLRKGTRVAFHYMAGLRLKVTIAFPYRYINPIDFIEQGFSAIIVKRAGGGL